MYVPLGPGSPLGPGLPDSPIIITEIRSSYEYNMASYMVYICDWI